MLRFILIVILIVLIIRFVLRLFMPLIISFAAKQAQATLESKFKQASPRQQRKPEGSIEVNYVPPASSKKKGNEGEFIDYEEIN